MSPKADRALSDPGASSSDEPCRLLTAAALVALVALVCGCGGASHEMTPPLDLTPGAMDLTVFVTSDAHFQEFTCPPDTSAAIEAMNSHVIGIANPAETGASVQTPSFVLAIGDMCDGGALAGKDASDQPTAGVPHNYHDQWQTYLSHFPLPGQQGTGDTYLEYPVYATTGNHDYYRDHGAKNRNPSLYVANQVAALYGGKVSSGGNVYYSFNADGVHFVMLGRWADPQVIKWLRSDLAAVGPQTPVVVSVHYCLSIKHYGQEELWYSAADRNLLGDVLAGYNVVAILTGHTHDEGAYRWTPDKPSSSAKSYTYDCFDDGSIGKKGNFGVLHITPSAFSYAEYQAEHNDNGSWKSGSFTSTRFRKSL